MAKPDPDHESARRNAAMFGRSLSTYAETVTMPILSCVAYSECLLNGCFLALALVRLSA